MAALQSPQPVVTGEAAVRLLAAVRELDGALFRSETVTQLFLAVKEVALDSLHGLWVGTMDASPAAKRLATGSLLSAAAVHEMLRDDAVFGACIEQYHQSLRDLYVGERCIDGDVVTYEGWTVDVAAGEMACLTRNGERAAALELALTTIVSQLLVAHCAALCALPSMAARGIVCAVPHAQPPQLEPLLRGLFSRLARADLVKSGALFCPWTTSILDVDLLLREAFRGALVNECVRLTKIVFYDADGALVATDAVAATPAALGVLLGGLGVDDEQEGAPQSGLPAADAAPAAPLSAVLPPRTVLRPWRNGGSGGFGAASAVPYSTIRTVFETTDAALRSSGDVFPSDSATALLRSPRSAASRSPRTVVRPLPATAHPPPVAKSVLRREGESADASQRVQMTQAVALPASAAPADTPPDDDAPVAVRIRDRRRP